MNKLTIDLQEAAALCAFFRRSRYELLQVLTNGHEVALWTFAARDVRAAEKAALMVRQYAKSQKGVMEGVTVRHARRVRLISYGESVDAVVCVEYPTLKQFVLHLDDEAVFECTSFLPGLSANVFIALLVD